LFSAVLAAYWQSKCVILILGNTCNATNGLQAYLSFNHVHAKIQARLLLNSRRISILGLHALLIVTRHSHLKCSEHHMSNGLHIEV